MSSTSSNQTNDHGGEELCKLRAELQNLTKKISTLESAEKLKNVILNNNDNDDDEDSMPPFKYSGNDGYLNYLQSEFPKQLENKVRHYTYLKQMRSIIIYYWIFFFLLLLLLLLDIS
jgi:hypothetical protein